MWCDFGRSYGTDVRRCEREGVDGPRFVRKHQPPTRGSCPSFVRGWVVGLVCVLCGRSLSFDCSLGSCEDSNCVGGAVLEAALCVGEAVYAKSCAFSEGGPGWLTERERGELLECSCAAKCEPPSLAEPPSAPSSVSRQVWVVGAGLLSSRRQLISLLAQPLLARVWPAGCGHVQSPSQWA